MNANETFESAQGDDDYDDSSSDTWSMEDNEGKDPTYDPKLDNFAIRTRKFPETYRKQGAKRRDEKQQQYHKNVKRSKR